MIIDIIVHIIAILIHCGVILTGFCIVMGLLAGALYIIYGLMRICEVIYWKVKEIMNGKN